MVGRAIALNLLIDHQVCVMDYSLDAVDKLLTINSNLRGGQLDVTDPDQ